MLSSFVYADTRSESKGSLLGGLTGAVLMGAVSTNMVIDYIGSNVHFSLSNLFQINNSSF